MSNTAVNCEAWVVYCIGTQEFLCGTPTNRRFGPFDEARIFRKRSAASNSKNMLASEKKPIVVSINVSVEKKLLFKAVLASE